MALLAGGFFFVGVLSELCEFFFWRGWVGEFCELRGGGLVNKKNEGNASRVALVVNQYCLNYLTTFYLTTKTITPPGKQQGRPR